MTEVGALPEAGLVARWRALSPGARVTLATLAVVLAVNALMAGIDASLGGDARGPTSSSYATAPDGLAAYADLLEARGHPVGRIRTSLDRAPLDPATTVVVADAPQVSDEEATALGWFVDAGGRLLVTGEGAPEVLRRLPIGGLTWSRQRVDRATPMAPVPEVEGVVSVRAEGSGSWQDPGATLPVLGAESAVLTTLLSSGEGVVVALADTSPWQNRLLDEADNAAFALAAAGEAGRPVRFVEWHHGFGASEGLAALPGRWRWALAGAALAALVWMWARGRRFGPPEEVERELSPPRRAYVDAVAASLARTRAPGEAIRPLQEAVRQRLARRAGITADADDEALRRAAKQLGVPEEDLAAVLTPARNDDDVMAVGRVLAWLEGRTG